MRASAARAAVGVVGGAVADALHEPEREVAVNLDEQPPVDGLLRLADRHGQEVLLERLERPAPQVDLHRQTRRPGHELLVRRAAHDAPEEAIRLLGLALREQEVGELEVDDEEPVVLRDGGAKLGDGVLGVLLRAVHLAEAPVALGVVGVQLDGARGVLDGVVVLVDLERVLGHALVELARALRLDLDQLLQHRDGLGDLAVLHQHALEREVALGVAGRELDDAAERHLGLAQAAQVQLRLGQHAPRLHVRRVLREGDLQRRHLRVQDALEAPERHDARAALARQGLVALVARLRDDLLVQLSGFAVGARPLVGGGQGLLEGQARGIERDRLLVRRERVGRHVVLDVHVAQRGQRLGARLHDDEDALPRRDGQGGVALLEVVIAEVHEVPGVARAARGEALQHLERALAVADARVEVGHARQRLLVGPGARLELRDELHRAGAVASLQKRLALLEDELRVVRARRE